MAISLNYADAVNTATFPAPTVADGDLMIATFISDDNDTVGASLTGWTEIHSAGHTAATLGYQALYKVASSESGDITFSTTGGQLISVLSIFRDSVGGGTWSLPDDSTAEANSATITTAAVANSTDDVMFCSFGNDNNRSVTTPPSGMTLVDGINQTSRSQFCYYEVLSSGSGSDTRTLVWNATEQTIGAAIVIRYTASGGAFTLTADSGSYTVSGTDASVLLSALLGADSGSYVYTGTDAGLNFGFVLVADSGTYSYGGTDAALTASFTIAGDSGLYTYSGTDAALNRGYYLSGDSGTYTYNGTEAVLTFAGAGAFTLIADTGAYTYTGTEVALEASFSLQGDSGSYIYAGTDADLNKGYPLIADSGSYVYSGADASILFKPVLSAETGTYTYSGTDAIITASGQVWTIQADAVTTWTEQSDSTTIWSEQTDSSTTWTIQ